MSALVSQTSDDRSVLIFLFLLFLLLLLDGVISGACAAADTGVIRRLGAGRQRQSLHLVHHDNGMHELLSRHHHEEEERREREKEEHELKRG